MISLRSSQGGSQPTGNVICAGKENHPYLAFSEITIYLLFDILDFQIQLLLGHYLQEQQQ